MRKYLRITTELLIIINLIMRSLLTIAAALLATDVNCGILPKEKRAPVVQNEYGYTDEELAVYYTKMEEWEAWL